MTKTRWILPVLCNTCHTSLHAEELFDPAHAMRQDLEEIYNQHIETGEIE